MKQEIRGNINNLRQQNELLLSGCSHRIPATEPVTNGAAHGIKVPPGPSGRTLNAGPRILEH